MISKTIEKAINDQMNLELYSAYLYLSMYAYFESVSLEGFAHWMRLQAQEELAHSMKLFDFVLERDGNAQLLAVKAPPAAWKSPLDACEDALEHEKENTKQINNLMNLSYAEKDYATQTLLHWFVQEQVEEEASAMKLVEKVRFAKESSGALFILDRELAKRQIAE